MKKVFFSVALFLILLLTFAVAELALSILNPYDRPPRIREGKYVYDSKTNVVQLAPSAKFVLDGADYTTNSLGYRDREYPFQKPQGTIRIAFLGDSFIEGMGEAQDKTIPKVLEAKLREELGPNIEVMNFGVRGGSASAYRIWLKTIERFNPDLYLVSFFHNDLADDADRLLKKSYAKSVAWWSLPESSRKINLISHIYTYYAYLKFKLNKKNVAKQVFGDENFARHKRVKYEDTYSIANDSYGYLYDPTGWDVHWERSRQHLDQLKKQLKGKPLLMIYIPSLSYFRWEEKSTLNDSLKPWLLDWCSKNSVPLVDLPEKITTWMKENNSERLYNNTSHFHFNELGLRKAAEWILPGTKTLPTFYINN